MYKLKALVADDQFHVRLELVSRLEDCTRPSLRPRISEASSAEEAVTLVEAAQAEGDPFDLILMDVDFGGGRQNGHWAASEIARLKSEAVFLIVSAYPSEENLALADANPAVTRFFRRKSFTDQELKKAALWALASQLHRKGELLPEKYRIYTQSPKMKAYLRALDEVSPEANIIIYGETGTGKELSARRLHANAELAQGASNLPFVAVDCGAIAPNLIESELFGHTKGAFTGATNDKVGILARANGGTLFLDEIQSASKALQQALMRAIQEGVYVPVGSTKPVSFKTRIVAALNLSLRDARKTGTLMPDFVARLRQDMVEIPPLRERQEDIPLLIKIVRERCGALDKEFSLDAIDFLKGLRWSENVRGFMSVCSSALSRSKLPIVTAEALRILPAIKDAMSADTDGFSSTDSNVIVPRSANGDLSSVVERLLEANMSLDEATEQFQRAYLTRLCSNGESISALARKLGMSYATLYRRLAELGITLSKN